MKITGKFLYDLQWEYPVGEVQPYQEASGYVRQHWEDFAKRINSALSVTQTNQDEQTDDSSGVPSHSLENEK